jgi:malate dehydrogenase (oxaloacetate-decarboxylating)(NADP+)
VKHKLSELGVGNPDSFEIHNAADSAHVEEMVTMLYDRLQRRGYMERDVRRMVNHDRNAFAAALLKLGVGDAMVTGITRPYAQTMRDVRHVLDAAPAACPLASTFWWPRTRRCSWPTPPATSAPAPRNWR